MYYSCLSVECTTGFAEILMAEVAEAGFETFIETDIGFEAYVEMEKFDRSRLDEISEKYKEDAGLTFSFTRVEKRNWNEEWEKSYEPIIVDNRCLIRASFHHIPEKYPHEITITPKMSFGTGHHQTTYLMVKNQLGIDHEDKRVMDAGCGTAILSVLASKLGAREVFAFDIDEWSMVNGRENAAVNDCFNIELRQGKIDEVRPQGEFDIILANINKNVLLQEISAYQSFLPCEGLLLLSGFYTHDIDDLLAEANTHGLHEKNRDERQGWASLLLQKL